MAGTAVKMDWREALTVWDRQALAHVLVTVLEAPGPGPRVAGTKMAVSATATAGSIGGGDLEARAVAAARRRLAEETEAAAPTMLALSGGVAGCGGPVRLLLELFVPSGRVLALFGAGHVGQALVRVLEGTGVRILWFDPRPGALPERTPPNVTPSAADPAAAAAAVPAGCDAVVMTHGHDLDFAVVEALLRRGGLRSIGLLGGSGKWAGFRRRLLEAGLPPAAVDAVTCPVGLPGVGGRRPAEIAIAIAAALLKTRSENAVTPAIET